MINALSINIAYKLERTLMYLKNGCLNNGINIDQNDWEDGSICLCLDMDKPNTLVTDDSGTLNAVKNGLEKIKKALGQNGDIKCRVISGRFFFK